MLCWHPPGGTAPGREVTNGMNLKSTGPRDINHAISYYDTMNLLEENLKGENTSI